MFRTLHAAPGHRRPHACTRSQAPACMHAPQSLRALGTTAASPHLQRVCYGAPRGMRVRVTSSCIADARPSVSINVSGGGPLRKPGWEDGSRGAGIMACSRMDWVTHPRQHWASWTAFKVRSSGKNQASCPTQADIGCSTPVHGDRRNRGTGHGRVVSRALLVETFRGGRVRLQRTGMRLVR